MSRNGWLTFSGIYKKVHKLEQVLRNDKYDYNKEIIKKVQQVRSHEVELGQLVDLLIGAVAYVNRRLNTSDAKNDLIELIRHRSKYSLQKSTLIKEKKFNICIRLSNFIRILKHVLLVAGRIL